MPSETDKVAILALLTRYQTEWVVYEVDQKALAEINAKVTAHNEQFARLHAAFSLFDLDTHEKGVWDKTKLVVGDDEYRRAVAEGTAMAEETLRQRTVVLADKQQEKGEQQEEAPGEEKSETAFSASSASNEPTSKTAFLTAPTVRDAVLERLKTIGSKGAKAAELQAFLEEQFRRKLHTKTVGMTLYRLSQEKLVRRDGRTWFFAPPIAATKNPGAGTPGSHQPENEER